MTTVERETPLVVAVAAVPLVGEGIAAAVEGLAECKVLPAGQPELAGLLKSLQPDAVVADDEAEAAVAATYARFGRVPVIRVDVRADRVQVLDQGAWVRPEEHDSSPETIRNLVAAGIYGRRLI